MSHILALDIETIPHPLAKAEGWLPVFDESEVKFGNTRDPEKRKAMVEEAHLNFEMSVAKKAGLDPDTLMICCIVAYSSRDDRWLEVSFKNEDEEYAGLQMISRLIESHLQEGATIVTYNGKSFDIPAIYRRCMLSDVRFPRSIYNRLCTRYNSERDHLDLMLALGTPSPFSSQPQVKKLEYWLARLGLPGKAEGWSGADVYPAFLQGRHDEILAYCKADVMALVELYERVAPWLVDDAAPITWITHKTDDPGLMELAKSA